MYSRVTTIFIVLDLLCAHRMLYRLLNSVDNFNFGAKGQGTYYIHMCILGFNWSPIV